MENEMPNENQLSLEIDSAPLLGNLKRSSAMAALSPKDRQRVEAKAFKMPAPVAPVLRERNKKGDDVKRKTVPNPVKVPARSALSYPERDERRAGPNPQTNAPPEPMGSAQGIGEHFSRCVETEASSEDRRVRFQLHMSEASTEEKYRRLTDDLQKYSLVALRWTPAL